MVLMVLIASRSPACIGVSTTGEELLDFLVEEYRCCVPWAGLEKKTYIEARHEFIIIKAGDLMSCPNL